MQVFKRHQGKIVFITFTIHSPDTKPPRVLYLTVSLLYISLKSSQLDTGWKHYHIYSIYKENGSNNVHRRKYTVMYVCWVQTQWHGNSLELPSEALMCSNTHGPSL